MKHTVGHTQMRGAVQFNERNPIIYPITTRTLRHNVKKIASAQPCDSNSFQQELIAPLDERFVSDLFSTSARVYSSHFEYVFFV